MCNWTTLAEEVLRAELPSFEAIQSIATLLQLERDPPEEKVNKAAGVLGTLLQLPKVLTLAIVDFEVNQK